MEHRRATVRPAGRGGHAARAGRRGGRRLAGPQRRPRRPRSEQVHRRWPQTVAALPRRPRGLATADPASILQPYAESTRPATRHRLRGRHGPRPHPLHAPDPGADRPAVRRRHRAPPWRGRAFTDTNIGTLGQSVRAVVPVRDDQAARRRPGLGRHHHPTRSTSKLLGQLPGAARSPPRRPCCSPRPAPGCSAAGCAARPTASARREMTRMYEYYDAVLHAVREGLLVLDRRPAGGAGQRRGRAACSGSTRTRR